MRLNNLRIGIAVRTSHDGGKTWSDPIELPHMGRAWHSADVSMAWKPGGDLYLSYIDYREAPDSDGVYVTHSSDGERWSTPVKAIDGFSNPDEPIDRPWIAVDPYSKTFYPRLYLVSKPPSWNPLPNHAYFTRSFDGAKTWDTLKILDEKPYSAALVTAPMASPYVANDGTLYIAVPTADASEGAHFGLALATSHDGGVTFDRSMIYTPTWSADTNLKNGYRLIGSGQNLLLAASGSPHGDPDVLAITSSNGGATWSDANRVNDDARASAQDMVWPVVSSDGTFAILWRDRRNAATTDSTNVPTDTYYAYSKNGGTSWSRNVRVSDSSAEYLPVLSGPGNDFMSGALEHDTLYAAWADTRSGNLHVYFAKTPLGGTAWVSTTDLSPHNARVTAIRVSPSTYDIHLDLPSGTPYELRFYDVLGREVHERISGQASDTRLRVTLKTASAFLVLDANGSDTILKF
jgi:hypothetical protein